MFSSGTKLKFYPRLNMWKNSSNTVNYNPTTCEGYSYKWCFVKTIKGKVVFNGCRYSTTTLNHQHAMHATLRGLDITIDVTVNTSASLHDIETKSLPELYRKLYTLEIMSKRKGAKDHHSYIQSVTNEISQCKLLGAKILLQDMEQIKLSCEAKEAQRKENVKNENLEKKKHKLECDQILNASFYNSSEIALGVPVWDSSDSVSNEALQRFKTTSETKYRNGNYFIDGNSLYYRTVSDASKGQVREELIAKKMLHKGNIVVIGNSDLRDAGKRMVFGRASRNYSDDSLENQLRSLHGVVNLRELLAYSGTSIELVDYNKDYFLFKNAEKCFLLTQVKIVGKNVFMNCLTRLLILSRRITLSL